MKATIHIIIVACSLGVAACSGKPAVERVGGVTDGFCVPPDGYIPPEVAYIPDDPVGMPAGFALSGCWGLRPEAKSTCGLPAELVAVSVQSLSIHQSSTWKELRLSTSFSQLSDPRLAYLEFDAGENLLLAEERGGRFWTLWEAEAHDANDAALRDGDTLYAMCEDADVMSLPFGRPDLPYLCYRYARGPEFALEYRYRSAGRIPARADTRRIESQIRAQLQQWRCKS